MRAFNWIRATLAVAAVASVGLGLAGCGDDEIGDPDRHRQIVAESEWQTITDPETGVAFRCLYINDRYTTSEFICYKADNADVTVGG